MKFFIYELLEHFFGIVERTASRLRERSALCPDCGRNRYSSEPCVGKEKAK